jgi:hypothetical protein
LPEDRITDSLMTASWKPDIEEIFMNPIGLLIIAATALFPAYQLFSLPNVTDTLALFSQYLGLAALILMAWGRCLPLELSISCSS